MNKEISRRNLLRLGAGTGALALIGVLGCSQERPDSPSIPSPIQTPSPEPTAAVINSPASTTKPERPPAEGWNRFVSTRYPYQIDYPEGWSVSKSVAEDWDLFVNGPPRMASSTSGVRVRAENVPERITLAIYAKQRLDSIIKEAKDITGGQTQVDGMTAEKYFYYYPWSSIPHEIGRFYEIAQGGYKNIVVSDTFVLKDRKMWHIQFVANANMEAEYIKYLEMLNNFKFLK